MERKVCPIHRYVYTGNECPICATERLIKLAERSLGEIASLPKERLEENKTETEVMHEMLNELKEKYNRH